MTNKRALSTLLPAMFAVMTAYGQHGILGGSGTSCRDGWKFSATYVLEPWSPAHQHVNIEGLSEVTHTDAKDGSPDTFHRVFVDPEAETYWGYDLQVEPLNETGTAQLRFQPLSLTADQLPKDYHPLQVPNVATFHALSSPQLPSGTFHSGQVIAVDVMRNPATGQKVVDYIEVEFEPVYSAATAELRDYSVSDVLLHIGNPSLSVNGADVSAALTIADRSLKSPLVWLAIPGHGRFLLSLCPHAGFGFQKAGVVSGFGLSFSWKGDRFNLVSRVQITEPTGNWNLYVLPAPSASADAEQGFAYGELLSPKAFVSQGQ